MLLNEPSVTEKKIRGNKILDLNESISTTYQSLWNTFQAMLKGKFITISPYIKKLEMYQVNERARKAAGKQIQDQKKNEIFKIREKVCQIETKRIINNIKESRIGSMKKKSTTQPM